MGPVINRLKEIIRDDQKLNVPDRLILLYYRERDEWLSKTLMDQMPFTLKVGTIIYKTSLQGHLEFSMFKTNYYNV